MNRPNPSREAQWIREGFTLTEDTGPFVPAIARVFVKQATPYPIFRVAVERAQCNGHGIAHGGFLATMADIWLARTVGHLRADNAPFVTADLSIDYLRPVPPGSWLESTIDRVKLGRQLCHASGAMLCGGEPAVAMRATFAVVKPPSGGD